MKTIVAVFTLVGSLGFTTTVLSDDSGCVVHYVRTACQGQEAESFKKCDGNAECEKSKPADSAEACAAAALKSCENSRLDITKYKVITAKFNGQDLVGGFDAAGNADPAGQNFCDKNRPDLNQCD
ncbi:MAG: hypothetical protein KDI63_11955 [Gammaproteobacteria bacterium]|nr:hypothetical protein [Gammaproteobacteria bacterium]